MKSQEIEELIQAGESIDFECKEARRSLPRSFFETYSSFANTEGGLVILGVKELSDHQFEISGVDPHPLIKDLWDSLNNRQKVSANILREEDIVQDTVEGKVILIIHIPRANREQRPIYKGQSPFSGTFRRNFEGDYLCNPQIVKSMLADQRSITADSKVLENFGLHDIDIETLRAYRHRFLNQNQTHAWNELNDADFLYEINAYGRDREKDVEGLTVAGLLMFGKSRSILDYLPGFFLEYREAGNREFQERWADRFTSIDGTWQANVYHFFFKSLERLIQNISVPFEMNGLYRKNESDVQVAMREALANTLIHADYFGSQGIVVQNNHNEFVFSNPGTLRVPLEQALRGGVSDPRNAYLFKIFALIGIGERAGSGIPTIRYIWKRKQWQPPFLEEDFQNDRTILKLKAISLLPEKSIHFIKNSLRGKFDDMKLDGDELMALTTAYQENEVTNVRLQQLLDKNSWEVNRLLTRLVVDKCLLQSTGFGRGTKYTLSERVFNRASEHTQKQISFFAANNHTNEKSSEINAQSSEINAQSSEINAQNSEINRDGELDQLWKITEIARQRKRLSRDQMEGLIMTLCTYKEFTIREMSQYLCRTPDSLRVGYIRKMVHEGTLEPLYKSDLHHPKQAYKTKED
ncbi:RNA-binding domain-containing protein [Sporolactobacillus vineae]|uniref:RNA-binding domain-containing protein n=1 Tax=Sporolactobacillus vineae TaxID=444463 RepID=UPI000288D02C|nr:RNA-binding domain-containing protein [Sporolactobacillus vineae]